MENSDLSSFPGSHTISAISETPAGDPVPCTPPPLLHERARECSRRTLLLQRPSPQLQQMQQLLGAIPIQVGPVLLGPNLVHFPLQLGDLGPGLCCSPIQCLRPEFKMVPSGPPSRPGGLRGKEAASPVRSGSYWSGIRKQAAAAFPLPTNGLL